jgi:hypothetical protein
LIAFFASLPDMLLNRACNFSFFSSPDHMWLSIRRHAVMGSPEIRTFLQMPLSLAMCPFLPLVPLDTDDSLSLECCPFGAFNGAFAPFHRAFQFLRA